MSTFQENYKNKNKKLTEKEDVPGRGAAPNRATWVWPHPSNRSLLPKVKMKILDSV